MNEAFYAYDTRKGVKPISWNDFFGLCKGLARAAAAYQPDVILGIARGGLYPATQIAHLLRVELYPIKLTRRHQDRVVFETPQWLLKPPPEVVRDGRVLIVDEICSEGHTLRAAVQEVQALGAAVTRTAVLYAHTWGAELSDYIGLVSDELILNPWDREIFQDGEFVMHPEYAHALGQQGLEPNPALLIGVEPYPLAKG